jgi:hypothetical protein
VLQSTGGPLIRKKRLDASEFSVNTAEIGKLSPQIETFHTILETLAEFDAEKRFGYAEHLLG